MRTAAPQNTMRSLHTPAGDFRDQLPPLIVDVHEQHRPVIIDGAWTHGLFEVRMLTSLCGNFENKSMRTASEVKVIYFYALAAHTSPKGFCACTCAEPCDAGHFSAGIQGCG